MNRFQFLFARFTGNERELASLSTTLQTINEELKGKTVAVVGNARALEHSCYGVNIDKAELVIRLNSSPLPNAASHGTRTDWIGTSIPLDQKLIDARRPQRVLWLTPKLKRLPWAIARKPGFFLNPSSFQTELSKEIGARPTTGLLILDLLRRSSVGQVDIYGFDFFASLSLSGSRKAGQVAHDFNVEQKWVQTLIQKDPRFSRPLN